MGLFDLFKRPKTEQEQYYEEYDRRAKQSNAFQSSNNSATSYDAPYKANDNFSQDFSITVEDVFTITGRGTVITGRIASGSVSVGDIVTLQRVNGFRCQVKITGIEMFRKILDRAEAGDNVGLLLQGLTRSDIGCGDILMK